MNWTENGSQVSTSASYIFTIAANRTLVANFAQITYTVTLSSNPPAGGTTTGGGTFNLGSSATVTAKPAAGFQFVNWTEGGTRVSTNASYTFTVTANRTLVANFSLITYTIATSSSPAAGGTTGGGGSYNSGSSATVTANPSAGYQFINWTENGTQVSNNASYTFKVTANRNFVANFTAISTGNTSVTVSPSTVQYSDRVTFTARITNGAALVGSYYNNIRVTFRVGTQVMGTVTMSESGNDLVGTYGPVQILESNNNGQMAPGVKTVTATFTRTFGSLTGVSPNPATTSLTITPEDARVSYTGTYLVSASRYGNSTLTLTADIRDISAVTGDPAYDSYAGDIRKARVRFLNGNVPISSWLTPSLMIRSTTTGRVTTTWTINSASKDMPNDINIEVGGPGYYVNNNPADGSIVTVYVPSQNYIAAGGYLNNPNNTAGEYAGDRGLKTNFGFVVKFTGRGNNPTGSLDFLVRKTVGGVLHTYQIKSGTITSLSVNNSWWYRTATINATASLVDITDPLAPVQIGDNLRLVTTMSDRNSGSNDRIGITLWDGSTLLFSSSRSGSSTNERSIDEGNIIVSSSYSFGGVNPTNSFVVVSDTKDDNTSVAMRVSEFGITAYPNPFTDHVYFDLQLKTDSKVRLEIYSIGGSKLATIFDDVVVAYDRYKLEFTPENFSTGTLIYRLVIDGKLMYTGKLIKY